MFRSTGVVSYKLEKVVVVDPQRNADGRSDSGGSGSR